MSDDLRFKHDFSARLRAAEMFAEGHGYKAVATGLGIPPTTVRQWHHKYIAVGVEGLSIMGKKYRSYDWKLKAAAAIAVVEGGELKADVMARYGIASLSRLEEWCRAYRKGGVDALRPRPKGRPKGGPKGPSSPPGEMAREQELERRIQKLEAENAYLKKSIALKAEKRSRTARKPRP